MRRYGIYVLHVCYCYICKPPTCSSINAVVLSVMMIVRRNAQRPNSLENSEMHRSRVRVLRQMRVVYSLPPLSSSSQRHHHHRRRLHHHCVTIDNNMICAVLSTQYDREG